MTRRRPEFEPGEADIEAAHVQYHGRCRWVSNSVAADDARADF